MAKASWVKVSPASGSGNVNVNVSSNTEHTGRVARTTILTWKAANVADVQRTVNQAGKPEYVDIADAASADKAGKVVTISGVSNSKRLTFSLGTGELTITLPTTYTANSITTNNGANINGDPGAASEYPFSITINVPANTSTSSKSRQIVVTDDGGNQDVCVLTSAAGDAYISVQMGDIELDYKGTAVTIAVESNTTWTIE
ncbi:MAG: hypothetical protein IIW52_05320 [Alistipes sp.]|nr:hypothetical protein [Alistipes sp.]